MKFTEYDKNTASKRKKTKDAWVADFDSDVSFLIAEARLKKGLTQAQLAKMVGTQQPSIARMEKGSSLPSLTFLKKVALAIGTSLVAPKFGFMLENDQPTSAVVTIVEEKPFPIYVQSRESSTHTEYSAVNSL